MKREKAEYPFDKYWIYKVFHRKENRWQANLILIDNISIRTTISYARYLMSVKLGRFLEKSEQVDHIDNDCTNDSINNLQILSQNENLSKQVESYWKNSGNQKYTKLLCANCNNEFEILTRNFKFKSKSGQEKFYCCRKCSYESLKR